MPGRKADLGGTAGKAAIRLNGASRPIRPEGGQPQNGSRTQAAPDPKTAGRIVFLRAQDGLRLAARIFDPPRSTPDSARLPLLCLPGLSRNSRDFGALGGYFAQHQAEPRKVVALDYRGRGFSDPSPDWRTYSPVVEAQDVLTIAAALGVETAVVVGTSRGGIIAMLLGALRPGLIAGVALNDIGPVVESGGLGRIKGYLPTIRRPLVSWDEATATLRAAGKAHFPALSEEDWRASARAIYAPTHRGLEPQFDGKLLNILESIHPGDKPPTLWPQFDSLTRVPVLAIRGANSDLLSARTVEEMAERHPRFEQIVVSGQGHAPLLRDAPTLERVRVFAGTCDSVG